MKKRSVDIGESPSGQLTSKCYIDVILVKSSGDDGDIKRVNLMTELKKVGTGDYQI